MNFQSIICSILFFLVSFSNKSALSCIQSDNVYQICLFNNSNVVSVSKSFHADQFRKQCHSHFVEEYMEKTCDHHHSHGRGTTGFQQHIPGIVGVLIISILSFVCLLTLPILHKASFEYILILLTSVSVGTLLGDAMFHLIPFIMGLHTHTHGHDHDHEHDDHLHHNHSLFVPSYQWKICLAVFILYLFYLLEVFLHWLAHHKHNLKSAHSHSHDRLNKNLDNYHYTSINNHAEIKPNNNLQIHVQTPSVYSNAKSFFNTNSLPCTPFVDEKEFNLNGNNPFASNEILSGIEDERNEQVSLPSKMFTAQFSNELNGIQPTIQKMKNKSAGWMVLFDDSIHNFANGLALNAAFSHNIYLGITTSIAVTCYRLRHEIGDYTVLLQSGFSRCRAFLWNFVSVLTIFLGFSLGIFISTDENTRQWIFVVTIGMFIYIALVDMLPTLLADGQFECKRFLIVNCGFIIGITSMFVLAIFEENSRKQD